MKVQRRHSGRPRGTVSTRKVVVAAKSHTVLAFTSTETSDEGKLTRQFFSDWCRETSAWTALPAGFFGGIAGKDVE